MVSRFIAGTKPKCDRVYAIDMQDYEVVHCGITCTCFPRWMAELHTKACIPKRRGYEAPTIPSLSKWL